MPLLSWARQPSRTVSSKPLRTLVGFPHHTPDSRRSKGSGFPDLVLRHDEIPPYIAVFELKTKSGRIREGQPAWIEAFRRAGVPAMIARLPRDWEAAMAILTGAGRAR